MKSNDFKGAHVLVLGAGVTGQSVKKVLTSFGAIVTLVDDALETPSDFSISQTDWKIAIASPGWPVDHPLVKELNSQGVSVISEIDLAWDLHLDLAPSQKWLAITGTNGKTTSVELTTAMLNSGGLNATACGNIGDTVIEAIMHEPPYDHLVLEISSYQLKWSKKPEFVSAAILNIADDHVDWHGSFEDYVASKISILDRSAIAVLNAGDGEVVLATQNWQGRKVFYSLDTPGAGEMGVVEDLLLDRAFVADAEEATVVAELAEVQPMAAHNVSNALAAAALALSVGVSHEDIRRTIKDFRPGRHRIETVLVSDGITWINDSKATNPHAALASLMSQESIIWIAGGLAKGAKMGDLVSRVHGRVKAAILIGRDRELIADELTRVAPQVQILRIDAAEENSLMEEVVRAALDLAKTGDVVMLAPACASMDQFISYSDRGDQFAEAVRKLVGKK
ncbi:MAG: UDP-N-acetylmuramoyl-L-alanine--D-glutamate ligase [Actinobacteria bacterium]|uniref:Unannotated protein n=1 Tax=freshwater metagenome TaxID=449393 RepID=A0A6J7TF68_9ZZZZ|nr:UDP-N-acetylmuramoyl-L-alanine--D-glutamate ligase [Actinomycetota bacterium]MSX24616.1 UDP-N-acetylmuramoyl-L-alanine--D-glutamate ligase [Actinomycetota bacterium]MSY46632.1 UDP-N-acetylmuramoyl-L-alanine--D-glutamate ligase [Actinomycetota bacterium]MSY57691.1 UDP-N-acetylmuramoyl-L-alanine--D-glutamate ligase [Actinomycetota bacterium]MTA99955.1 UDP-N-acetylmuramoyl-L-alanine--D-glutamate ligase [Actinomycetota bacterium]